MPLKLVWRHIQSSTKIFLENIYGRFIRPFFFIAGKIYCLTIYLKIMKLNILYLSSLLLFPVGLFANEIDSGDTGWILTSTALVLFMTLPGLALFYAGLVRSKNILSVLMQCFTLACVCLLYTSPSPRDATLSRMPSSA